MRAGKAALALGAVSLLLASGVRVFAEPFAATVNGVGIPRDRLEASVNEYLSRRGTGFQFITQPAQYKEIRRRVLDVLIARELLWQRARDRDLAASDAEVEREVARIREGYASPESFRTELLIGGHTEETYAEQVRRDLSIARLVREEIAGTVVVTDEEVEAFYAESIGGVRRPEEVRVRHILVKVPQGAGEEADREARERIGRILAEAKAGKDFARLAASRSEDESASSGGDLGFLSREQLVKPFADAAFALAPGEVSGPVRTPFGYHLIRLEERRGGDPLSREEAAPRIREHVRSVKIEKALETHVDRLRAASEVRIMEPR